jgi:hypothetical protein
MKKKIIAAVLAAGALAGAAASIVGDSQPLPHHAVASIVGDPHQCQGGSPGPGCG